MHRLHALKTRFFTAAVFVFVWFTAPGFAYRLEFAANFEGKRVPGAEICFFRAAAADNPFSRYLTSDDVRCLPADMVVDLPAGQWNYFSRHEAKGYVSTHPGMVSYDGPRENESGYKLINLDLQRAARLDFSRLRSSLKEGERFVVYYPNWQSDLGSAVQPLSRGDLSLLVPADVPLLPLIVSSGRITAILNTIAVPPGVTGQPTLRHLAAGMMDVVCWIKLDRELMIAANLSDDQMAPFEISMTTGHSPASTPLFPILHGAATHMSFQFFTNVPAGTTHIALRGRTWEQADLSPGTLAASSVNNIGEPLLASPSSCVDVRWDRRAIAGDPVEVRLWSCSRAQPGKPVKELGTSDCRVVRRAPLPSGTARASVEFPGVPAGIYVVSLGLEKGMKVSEAFYAACGRQATIEFNAGQLTH